MSDKLYLQDTYAPHNACFGCGPANLQGLRVRSFVDADVVRAVWTPQTMHEAFDNILSGGIIGTLLDCHCNWTAAWHLMQQSASAAPPCTVTAEYKIKLLRPTPTDGPVDLEARVVSHAADRAVIEGVLISRGKACALCFGTFVAVKPGHPAYHRW